VLGQLLRRGCEIHIRVGDKTASDFYIPPERRRQLLDGGIEVAVFHAQLGQQMGDFSVVLNLHGNGCGGEEVS
jgi:hypothetical protein